VKAIAALVLFPVSIARVVLGMTAVFANPRLEVNARKNSMADKRKLPSIGWFGGNAHGIAAVHAKIRAAREFWMAAA